MRFTLLVVVGNGSVGQAWLLPVGRCSRAVGKTHPLLTTSRSAKKRWLNSVPKRVCWAQPRLPAPPASPTRVSVCGWRAEAPSQEGREEGWEPGGKEGAAPQPLLGAPRLIFTHSLTFFLKVRICTLNTGYLQARTTQPRLKFFIQRL